MLSALFKYSKGPWVFFGLYLILGLSIVNDYGISWDEPLQRNHGLVSMDFINELSGGLLYSGNLSEDKWEGYPYKDHGVIFQLTCLAIEKLSGTTNYHDIFLIRHIVGFLIHFIGCLALFGLFRMRWDSGRALLGVLIFILTPRIFGHSFFNPKDTIALGWYNLSMFTAVRFLHKPVWRRALFHAIATALLINSRLFGVYIIASTCGLFVLSELLRRNFKLGSWKWGTLVLYVVGAVVFVHLVWPNMWEDPINNLYYGLRRVSKYHWLGDILFDGHWVPAQDIPWYYLPVWMGITVPSAYLVFAVIGVVVSAVVFLAHLIQRKYETADLMDIAILVFSIGPAFAVIIKESVMYDGWRHMYFIYGGVVYLAVLGYFYVEAKLLRQPISIRFVRFFPFIYLVLIAVVMIRMHPFQQTYFNGIPSKQLTGRFEADYWGTSFKQLLERIDKKYPHEELVLYSRSEPLHFNYQASSNQIKKHISVVPANEFPPENYVLCTVFRGKYDQFLFQTKPELFSDPLVEIWSNGNLIAGAYRINRE